ncbi:MAG TPA: hypothetical protein VLA84_14790 [Microcoleus sp.]|nr:hypothetical protein [Microcoleus sp.]
MKSARLAELGATACGYIGNFLLQCYQGAIVDYLLGRSNICAHYDRMTQQFFTNCSSNQSIAV